VTHSVCGTGEEGWQRFVTMARPDALAEAVHWAMAERAERAVWGGS